jgi:antitoxin YefM
MAIHTSYAKARANLAKFLKVSDGKEIVMINRRNAEDVAMISASELSGLLETAHLLGSHKNASRLLFIMKGKSSFSVQDKRSLE